MSSFEKKDGTLCFQALFLCVPVVFALYCTSVKFFQDCGIHPTFTYLCWTAMPIFLPLGSAFLLLKQFFCCFMPHKWLKEWLWKRCAILLGHILSICSLRLSIRISWGKWGYPGFSTRTGPTLTSAIFLQPQVRTCFQQESVTTVQLHTVLIACDTAVVVVYCSS
jgi:hypothetical protein